MAKKRNGKMTFRQLQMLEMKAEGKTYTEIGMFFGISGTGAQQNVFAAAFLLKRFGVEALPDGTHPDHSVDELIDAVPKVRDLPAPVPAENITVPPRKLTVPTPLGDIVVSAKMDSEYPGIYIDLKGAEVNNEFGGKDGSAFLATIEFDPIKGKIQSVIYGDANREEFTHLVEHKNTTKNMIKPPLSEAIQNASSRVETASQSGPVPDHTRE